MSDRTEEVKKIVLHQLFDYRVNKIDDIKENESFKSMGADSLDEVELIMTFEEVFNIAVSDEDAEKITTVKDAVDYLNKVKGN